MTESQQGSSTDGKKRERYLRIIALLLVIAISVVAFIFRARLGEARHSLIAFAYGGVFLFTLLANASIVIPLPGAVGVIIAGSTLSPFWVGLAAGAGSTLGETTGYLLGFSGRGVVESRQFYQRAVRWLSRSGWLALLVFSTIPNPLFDMVGIAAGALRYPFWRFLLFAWIGKTIKCLGLAYAGSLGLNALFGVLQLG